MVPQWIGCCLVGAKTMMSDALALGLEALGRGGCTESCVGLTEFAMESNVHHYHVRNDYEMENGFLLFMIV